MSHAQAIRNKAELVEALPKAPDGISILNADEPIVMAMRDKASSRIFTYGLNSSADLWASDVHSMGLNGIRFRVHYDGDTLHVRVPLLGRHSVHTASVSYTHLTLPTKRIV